jgi:hypothetical protein
VANVDSIQLSRRLIPNTNIVESSSQGTVLLSLHIHGETTASTSKSLDIRVSDVLVERCVVARRLQTVEDPSGNKILNLFVVNSQLNNVRISGSSFRIEGCSIVTWESRIENCFINHCSIRPGRSTGGTAAPASLVNCVVENSIIQAVSNKSGLDLNNTQIRGCVFMPLREGEFQNIGESDSNTIIPIAKYNEVILGEGEFPFYWQLKPDGLAIGKGLNGVDPGFLSGPRPYVFGGLPPIPAITELRVPTVVSKQSGLPLRIKAAVRR